MNQSFPRSMRMMDDASFSRVLTAPRDHRLRLNRRDFHLSLVWREKPPARLGFRIAARHLKRAVDRSALRRVVRECFRLKNACISPCDLIFHSHPGIRPDRLKQSLCEALESLTKKGGTA